MFGFGRGDRAEHLQKGQQAEQAARRYLQQQGLQWLASNVRTPYGELDLVMLDGATLIIIEVRFRQSMQFGGAQASVTSKKQAHIIAATQHYVIINRLSNAAIRFDVIAITGNRQIDWIKNAFQSPT
jgi:putative endonuclease